MLLVTHLLPYRSEPDTTGTPQIGDCRHVVYWPYAMTFTELHPNTQCGLIVPKGCSSKCVVPACASPQGHHAILWLAYIMATEGTRPAHGSA